MVEDVDSTDRFLLIFSALIRLSGLTSVCLRFPSPTVCCVLSQEWIFCQNRR